MNTKYTLSVTWKKFRELAVLHNIQITKRLAQGLKYVVLLAAISFGGQQISPEPVTVMAASPDIASLLAMANNGEEQAALQLVANEATARGGWMPAPGDTIVYDPGLPRLTRGSVLMIDTPPVECADARLSRGLDACTRDFGRHQNQIRFGAAMFFTPEHDGSLRPRSVFDDLLSTYIEEVAHSWQEYLYETEGEGSGPRTRQTPWEEGHYWAAGWEYQAKRYILSLDGSLLALSHEEHNQLLTDICAEGYVLYANPMGQHVPSFGPPSGWPNPQGWPVTNPTPEEFDAFCANG